MAMNGSPQRQEQQQQKVDEEPALASTSSARNSLGIELSDDEEWNSLVERAVLERTKSDRRGGGDERRRRTIIVEKKNGTYGFTLQSYGIHYKREQEIEMLTYVDYVEYDGPAFKAGMREGDVIISINGTDLENADHKTLVNFIKNCDARMRMVVCFKDCVRKVELHMRYIELQRALQSRLAELERLCERERSILMGRWKTHSLPARKRNPSAQVETLVEPITSTTSLNSSAGAQSCCRPASSTEHLLLYSVYADGRSYLIPRNTACLVAIGPPRSRSDHHHFLSNVSMESAGTATTSTSSRHSYHQTNGLSSNSNSTPSKSKDRSSSHGSVKSSSSSQCKSQQQQQQPSENQSLYPSARNLCVACISSARRRERSSGGGGGGGGSNNGNNDNGSLDAYDLAGSPCCDPNCVPTRRRRDKHRRSSRHEQGSQTHQHQVWHRHLQQQQQQQQQREQPREHHDKNSAHGQCIRASGHSLHSLASSELSSGVGGVGGGNDSTVASCSTSLSTDTLYWDPGVHRRPPPPCMQYAKPKSWDNLTTKAFGGYGFGYGYLDTAKSAAAGGGNTHSAERPAKSGNSHHRAKTPTSSQSQRRSTGTQVYSSRSGHFQPTKSTESLLITTTTTAIYPGDLDATLSCECLDGPNPRYVTVQLDKQQQQQQHKHRRSSSTKQRNSVNGSEITRL